MADRQRVGLPQRLLAHLRRGRRRQQQQQQQRRGHEVRRVPPSAARDELRVQEEDDPEAVRARQESRSVTAPPEVRN